MGYAHDMPAELSILDVPAEARALTAMRAELLTWLLGRGISEVRAHDITLAAYEALANCVEHAYTNVSGTVGLTASGNGDGRVGVTVVDTGAWHTATDDPMRGRGLPLMHALADTIEIDKTSHGTTVHMHWD